MKLNKLILVSIFLLAILTLGAVSASDNLTASEDAQDLNLAVESNAPIADNQPDEIVGDGEAGQCNVTFPNSMKAAERSTVNLTFPEGSMGNLEWSIDDEESSEYLYDDEPFSIPFYFSSSGSHYIDVKFISSDESICKSSSFHRDYTVNDYVVDISVDRETTVYGGDAEIWFAFPSDASGIATITVNGIKRTYDLSEDYVDDWIAESVNVSTINVTVSYSKDSKYKAKTFTKVFNVGPDVKLPYKVSFKDQPSVLIRYVDNIPINVKVYHVDDMSDERTLISDENVTTKNNELNYVLPGTFELGKRYEVAVRYLDFGEADYCDIIPDTNFTTKIWVNANDTYYMEFPSDCAGKNVALEIYDRTLYEGVLDSDCRITFALGSLEVGDYYINCRVGDDLIWDSYFDVFTSNPNYYLNATIASSAIIKNGKITVYVPENMDLDGAISFYIDGIKKKATGGDGEGDYYLSSEGLTEGNHTLSVALEKDSYYKPTSQNFTFEIFDHIIEVPQTVIINSANHMDYSAYVRLPEGATGLVTFYIDGKSKKSVKFEEYWDEDDFSEYISYDLSGLNVNRNHTLKIVYKGDKNNKAFTKTYNLSMDFNVRISLTSGYQYGISNEIGLVLPPNSKAEFEIYIDGNRFNKYYAAGEDEDNYFFIDISEFAGTHEIFVVYKGDNVYEPCNVSETFDVECVIHNSYYVPYGMDKDSVTLSLPSDAKGNLVVRIDNENYAVVPLVNGTAGVSFANLSMGGYYLSAYYDGNDYNVTELTDTYMEVGGMIQAYRNGVLLSDNLYDAYIGYGDELYFYLKLPEAASGKLEVNLGNDVYEADLINGTAKVTMPLLNTGEYEVYARYVSDEYYNVEGIQEFFKVSPVLLPISKMVVFGKNMVYLNASKGFMAEVEIVIDEDWDNVYSALFKNGIAGVSLSKITAGTHTIRITCTDGIVDYYYGAINVTVAKAKSAKLTAAVTNVYYGQAAYRAVLLGADGKALKNAKVIFKVNGKAAKTVKTNVNGIAVFKIQNLPKTYKVTAQYGKLAVTKKVTIKRVISLKAATIKKSAKKLILQATLKKGKTPIKWGKVVFRLNGKPVKIVTTNANGVAKAYISQTTLKSLKVGKTVVYSATYIKDTVKRSAKVIK